MMRISRGIRKQLMAAGLGVSLLQPIAVGAVGSFLLGAAAGDVRAQQTLNTEAIGRIAQAITVRIEGATQGSGVLVKRDGNRYTVLTAWHVVSAQRPGEEVAIYTPDGKSHAVVPGSIMRVGQVDLAVLTFTSETTYQLARIGDVKSVSSGSSVFIGGFPMATSSVPSRVFRFRDGRLEVNAQVFIPNGRQMLYTNQTLPGMSGGAVLNQEGRVVGIHASAERADEISEISGKAVATGTNQGVPILYFSQYISGREVSAIARVPAMPDDYLAQAEQLLGLSGKEDKVIDLASNAIRLRPSARAYRYRGWALADIGEYSSALSDYKTALLASDDPEISKSILWAMSTLLRNMRDQGDPRPNRDDLEMTAQRLKALKASDPMTNYHIAGLHLALGNDNEANGALKLAATTPAANLDQLLYRGLAQWKVGLIDNSIATFTQVIGSPEATAYQRSSAYANRSSLYFYIRQRDQACRDMKEAVRLRNPYATKYFSSNSNTWCK